MKPYEIDAQALKFKQFGNKEFDPLVEHYKPICQKWFRHVYKRTGIDRDEFFERFYLLLYRSLQKYNPEFTQDFDIVQSKFDRYFLAAVRNLSITYLRSSAIRNSKPQRVRLDDVDLPVVVNRLEEVYLEDLISLIKDPVDRQIVKMRVLGNSRRDVCEVLGLKLHQYRAHLNRIQHHPSIV